MSSTLKPGQELHSDSIVYRIESVLGQGSFGITYKARAFAVIKGKFGEELVEIKTPKAIKEFFMKDINEREPSGSITGMTKDSLSYKYALKFKKEAENLSGMNHPNIVKVLDFFGANGTFYYVMDYIEGESLKDYLKHHRMSEKEATDTIIEVAKALKYMHEEKNMLHLDLKPGNIMRRKSDGHIFLIDFGLSKHYSDEGQPDTSTTIGLGTEGYAPLEQGKRASAQNSFRPTIDVYALGGTLFKMLTGETPPPASDILEDEDMFCGIMESRGIDSQLQGIIKKAMVPSAKRRTASVAEFLSSLESPAQDGVEITNMVKEAEPISAPKPSPKLKIEAKQKAKSKLVPEHSQILDVVEETPKAATKKKESAHNSAEDNTEETIIYQSGKESQKISTKQKNGSTGDPNNIEDKKSKITEESQSNPQIVSNSSQTSGLDDEDGFFSDEDGFFSKVWKIIRGIFVFLFGLYFWINVFKSCS